MTTRSLRPLAFALVALCLVFSSAAHAADVTVADLLKQADDMMRGDQSVGQMTMQVKTARWERKLTMKIWTQGTEKTLIQILSPAKEKGTATLKVDQNIWNYLPKVDRTIKVPAAMMSGSWMGSHFTNDDLVKESRYTDDFNCALKGTPEQSADKKYLIECIPKADAAVVWGKVVIKATADKLPSEVLYFDEKGKQMRAMVYQDVGDLGGRRIPRTMMLTTADKPGEFTRVTFDELSFDTAIPDSTFSLRALKR